MDSIHFFARNGQTAFDAELEAIVRGLQSIAEERRTAVTYSIFTDSMAAMERLRNDLPGPGQRRAAFGIRLAQIVAARGSYVDIYWVVGHAGVECNE